MGHNSFGHEFSFTTFGESHGKAIGVVIDGVQSGFPIDWDAVQAMMNRRRPGGNSLGTKRNESDAVTVLSGIYQGKTTGAPIALLIPNNDQHSSDYDELAHLYRPGHADYTLMQKWGIRDSRGGGRSSGRETAARVAAGAIATQILASYGITLKAGTVQIGAIRAEKRDWKEADNELTCPDKEATVKMLDLIEQARMDLDSVGGVVECHATGLPTGLGEPTFDKLQALLAHAMFSIGAVRGFEIGEGFHAAEMRGSEDNDQMEPSGFLSNHAGGILGGISNGQELVFRVAFKPTSSISRHQKTVDEQGNPVDLVVKGRHDPCIVPRAVVVVEAMTAAVLLDAWYMDKAHRT